MQALTLTPYEIIERKINTEIYHPQREYPSYKDPARNENMKLYRQEQDEKKALFKNDLLETFGVKDHPKAEKAFRLAWELGHGVGFYEVLTHFNNFVELITD